MSRKRRSIKKKKTVKTLLLILIIIILGWSTYKITSAFFGKVGTDSAYDAVFLDNNQVYFGKVSNTEDVFIKLSDVYYFGPNPDLQDGQANGDDIVLVKLGSELHGPTDEMQINNDHILYIEKLSSNSRVVQAILDYKTQE